MERQFERRLEALKPIGAFLREAADRHGLDESLSYLLNLVVEELFTNIIKYGNKSSVEVPISVTKDGQRVIIRIVDRDASPFDPTRAPEPDTESDLKDRKVGGLGIHIIRQMVDALEYKYDGTTSEIIAIKNLESSNAGN